MSTRWAPLGYKIEYFEDEESHLDCQPCSSKCEFHIEEGNLRRYGYMLHRYVFARMKLSFMDDVLLDELRKIVSRSVRVKITSKNCILPIFLDQIQWAKTPRKEALLSLQLALQYDLLL